ncbi:MAG TPA: T9SS type A sorting domain-containing protein [Bacteroidia bacterium]|nr:T9SS type A sorting domain-containing protein [Bacteroidia bacterium]
MKKITLFIAAASACISATAQQPNTRPERAVDKRTFIDAPVQTPSIVSTQYKVRPPAPSGNGAAKSINAITSVQLGSAANVLTVYQPENNLVAAEEGFGTVVFIHRNNPTIYPLTSSQFRYDISTDKGSTFTNDIGPLNPLADGLVGGINGRYPQTVFYNPPGNTVRDSMYGAYFGTWHNGATTNDTWEGSQTGVYRMDGSPTTWTETNTQQNGGNVMIAASLCNGLPGEFWAVDWEFAGTADSVILVFKGVWNSSTHDVAWTIAHRLNPALIVDGTGATFKINPLIAFDPTGMKGWVAFSGDVSGNGIYQPAFFKTTDGGATWTGPIAYDMAADAGIMSTMNAAGSGVPTTGFESDLVVDMNGDPHFVNVVSSGTNHSIETAYTKTVYDFTYSNASSTWSAIAVDTVQTFRGILCTDGASGNYITDNRPQLSMSPASDIVFYFWSDTDPLFDGGNNSFPDLWGKGRAVNNGWWSPTTNFTFADAVWGLPSGSKPVAWPCTAPKAFRNATNDGTCVPVVVTSINASSIGIDPCDFHYFNNICFDDVYFVSVPENNASENIVRVFPNPAIDEITISLIGIANGTAHVTLSDVLGRTVKDFGNSFTGSARYSVRGLDAGVYFVNIKTENGTASRQVVITK